MPLPSRPERGLSHPVKFSAVPYRTRGSLVLLLISLVLSACGLLPDKDPDELPENWPEDKLYFAAKDRLDAGSCDGAIEYYEKLQGRYPFGPYAAQAQIELGYCYYKLSLIHI